MATANTALFAVTVLTALGCGLMAGTFSVFSVAVMKALARLPAAAGIAAMQSINLVILNPLFLGVFLGTALGCVVLGANALWRGDGSWYTIAGALFYLCGSLLVTMVCNVPRNNALAALKPDDPAAVALWRDYLSQWTAWNHVRTVACLLAAALLITS